jgi:hypothetical protein
MTQTNQDIYGLILTILFYFSLCGIRIHTRVQYVTKFTFINKDELRGPACREDIFFAFFFLLLYALDFLLELSFSFLDRQLVGS